MDIRPHRRIIIPFTSSYFPTMLDIVTFASDLYEHFGVAKFDGSTLGWMPLSSIKSMCDSIGVRLMVSTIDHEGRHDPDILASALSCSVDYIITVPHDIPSNPGSCKVLPYYSGFAVLSDPSSNLACPPSFVKDYRDSGCKGIITTIGELDSESAIKSMEDGSDFVEVGKSVFNPPSDKPFRSEREFNRHRSSSLRRLADSFRVST